MLTHLNATPADPTRVVILGANGFVARGLTRSLAAAGVATRSISSREVDLTDRAAGAALAKILQSGDAVVMTSALTPEKGRDITTLMKNLEMAVQVAQAIAGRPCAHLIYISSDAVYDWRHPLISEDLAPSPTDLYSLMHLARERMLAQATATAKIPFCVLRPCAIYGPGDTHDSYGPNRFVRTALAEGKIRLFGAGEETRDHVLIDDVAAVIELSLRHRSTGVLNVVTGRNAAFSEVAGLIARLSPRPVAIETRPRSGPITHRHFDPTGLHASFPEFSPTALEHGLRKLLRPA